MYVSRRTKLYIRFRKALVPIGPRLSWIGPLRRAVWRMDDRFVRPGEVQVSTADGWTIWVNPGDKVVAQTLIATGRWQAVETQMIADALPVGGVGIDVGANLGYVTGLMAEKVGPRGRVLSFEPGGVNFELLSRTVAANGWSHVSIKKAACGERSGEFTLYRDPDNWGNHSLAFDARLHTAGGEAVEVVPLDDAAAEMARVDVIKIDVQGWELAVLRGAQKLKRYKPVLFVEFFPRGLRAAGTEPADLWAELLTWGRILEIRNDGTTAPITLEEAIGDVSAISRNVDLVIRP